MGKRNKRDAISRKSKRKPSQKSVLIVCEGEKTEPNYFKSLINSLNKPNLRVQVVGEGYNTQSLVSRARQLASNGAFGQVWLVFDKDDFPDFDIAINMAHNNGYEPAYSNEAFEIWYLLHFHHVDAGLSRKQYKEKLEEFVRKRSGEKSWKYEKNAPNIYELLSQYGDEKQACGRAEELVNINATGNPSTTVHRLVTYLRES